MADQPQPAPPAEGLRMAAAQLAARFGVATDSVGNVLTRVTDVLRPPGALEGMDGAVQSYAFRLVWDALSALPNEQALVLFEDEDVPTLVRRVQAADYLADRFTPFYTTAELANHLAAFLTFLGRHQDFL